MTAARPEHRVDVVEGKSSARAGRIRCVIDEHLRFDTAGIETYCQADGNTTAYDACVVGAAVQFCDQTKRRRSTDWSRGIALRVPVHDPGLWRKPAVSGALHDALSLLTGDRWRIDFTRRKKDFRPRREPGFSFPSPCIVVPFSDGLDSYVATRLLRQEHRDTVVPVRLGSKPLPGRRRRTRSSRPRAFASMPWRVSYGKSGSVETSARSRGFRFSLLSGIAAFLCKSRRIVLPESGQGALGPSLVPVGQAYADVRSHPRFTSKMEGLVWALFGHEVRFEHPHLWRTKGETLSAFLELHPDDPSWTGTRSCWQNARRVSVSGRLRQCGICAACLLRRMSAHAAGRCEVPETYVWEDLRVPCFEDGAAPAFRPRRLTGAFHEYAIAGVLHLEHLATLRRSPANAVALKRQAFLLTRSLGLGEGGARPKLERLLRRHEEEWRDFVGSLGPRSFVAQWVARGH